jgi:hypothetical protein
MERTLLLTECRGTVKYVRPVKPTFRVWNPNSCTAIFLIKESIIQNIRSDLKKSSFCVFALSEGPLFLEPECSFSADTGIWLLLHFSLPNMNEALARHSSVRILR